MDKRIIYALLLTGFGVFAYILYAGSSVFDAMRAERKSGWILQCQAQFSDKGLNAEDVETRCKCFVSKHNAEDILALERFTKLSFEDFSKLQECN